MIPIVNDRHRYILLYSAKAGCTSIRQLYLAIHRDEMSSAQQSQLNWYHNINEIHFYDSNKDYSTYNTLLISRNPYARVVSAFLDQYVYARNSRVQNMLASVGRNEQNRPRNFLEFLELLQQIPDAERDTHFQTQAYFPYASMVVTNASPRYRLLKQKPPHAFGIRQNGDISQLNKLAKRFFKRVFGNNRAVLTHALTQLQTLKKSNSSFYGNQSHPNAAELDVATLDGLVFAPKPQDFLSDHRVTDSIEAIYARDFELFGYKIGDIPHKATSAELQALPEDFDWQMYLRLNPDLPRDQVYNERGVVRHYLEFGQFEEHPRAYKIEAPAGFNWQRYLELNTDLPAQGITSEMAAIEHYISYGIRQHRPF